MLWRLNTHICSCNAIMVVIFFFHLTNDISCWWWEQITPACNFLMNSRFVLSKLHVKFTTISGVDDKRMNDTVNTGLHLCT